MKVLFVNANRFKQPWPVIPFGLCSVVAYVEREGHEVKVLDLCFSSNPPKDIEETIRHWQPEVIGVSIRNIDNSVGYNTLFLLKETKHQITDPLKKLFDGPIIIGGPSVGINGREMLGYLDLNYAIRGDGEAAFVEFINRQSRGLPFDGMAGLVIRKGGEVIQDPPPWRVENINTLPPVKPHRYIDVKAYSRFDSPLQIQTKRGCPLRCTYCTYNEIEGNSWRLRDPQKVADEIEELVNETGINHIEFTDSTFNVPLNHAKAVLNAIVGKKLNLRLRTMGLNPAAVDDELADLIKSAGFRDVDLGVESGSDITLKGLGKSFTKEDVVRAGRLLNERHVPVTWYLLVGAPGETRETLLETFETINNAASKWDFINIGVGIRVYKGSPIARKMQQQNPSCTYDEFLHPVHFSPENITLEEVKIITKKMALKHPNYFMYDEDETVPALALMVGSSLLKLFAPRQPFWRLFIIMRKIQRMLGISLMRRVLYNFKHP